MIALIDADIVAFRTAAASEDTDLDIACLRADKLMHDILFVTEADSYKSFLTGKNNFRKTIYPEYKANRKDKPKPIHLQGIRDFLVSEWSTEISEGCEADDLLGINQSEETICCSIDKDLLQLPGKHYNWVRSEFVNQTTFSGLVQFYLQLLQGDKSDNIPGIYGIGPKKAEKILEGITNEQDLFNTCISMYKGDIDTVVRNGKLLWIWRTDKGIWDPTYLIGNYLSKQKEEVKLNYTMQKEVETSPLSEPTEQEILGM